MLQGNEQVIFVVKKNKTRLERLIGWMSGRVPGHVSVLVIDDEADQASVNTGGNRAIRDEVDLVGGADFEGEVPGEDELDPSTINLNVRRLLRSFVRCSYVAYTATPFANVLIDPSAFDVEGGNDLFPSHFIISLPTPPGEVYVGAAQLFGRDRLPGDAETSTARRPRRHRVRARPRDRHARASPRATRRVHPDNSPESEAGAGRLRLGICWLVAQIRQGRAVHDAYSYGYAASDAGPTGARGCRRARLYSATLVV